MKKTLLLCFIHGFKGGDDTFGGFPEHIRALVSHGLPKVAVRAITYPQYETRGDLKELQEKVIDIEVENGTPSPTVDPSVRTILIGHSMGGIVAADTVIAITSDKAIDSKETTDSLNTFMFPYVQGVLAFDTPYLGISPGVVAHGAEGHYNAFSSAFAQVSTLAGAIWGEKEVDKSVKEKKPMAALPAPPPPEAPAWKKWGTMAMYAGAAGAVAAGGVTAYFKKDQIQEGWSWVGSHLEFVGCLMKGEELKKRVAGMVTLQKELGVGWANLYTRLGKEAVSKADGSLVGSVIGNQRTFCNLPKTSAKNFFYEAINDKAKDETGAHTAMFFPKENPGYYALSEKAAKLIMKWSMNEWYESSTKDAPAISQQVENQI
ncbi:alpha beta-Hydrolase protein [Rutstroemia sp. NJR-2017a WRK4]|nr:alpha beta-Hydrolase protein [Rutstroemia sp. NJR-2017a WRK4]